MIRDPRVLYSFESADARLAEPLDTVIFGQCFHEVFVKGVIEEGVKPHFEGAPLSARA